jgi:hypothetical protein
VLLGCKWLGSQIYLRVDAEGLNDSFAILLRSGVRSPLPTGVGDLCTDVGVVAML